MQTGNLLFKPKETLKDKFGGNMLSQHQKRVAMILLPFHKHQRVDGAMESIGRVPRSEQTCLAASSFLRWDSCG
ncbi:BnaC01g35010D [Brassica napus]|uniref:Uncharacterized protein n=3 Tax=Brassica TaxID=3705 RepID=A0A0D3ACT7_BRAOL|nr:unnamed protein product [Brassica napus]CDY46054.1 BnaC01g35010D [Brassica napus]VDD52237.1 unnamed protein product [Brassica oleracea]